MAPGDVPFQAMTATAPTKLVEPVVGKFRGWWILAIAILTVGLTGPGQTIGVSVFVDHFIADLGLSRSAVTQAYFFGTLGGSFALPWVGLALDRYGVRKGQAIIGALFALALINMSAVQNWVWLAVGFVFIRMLGQGSLSMCTTVAVSHWFDRKRGTAMGLLAVGGGALMALVPIILNQGIEAWGWRQTWLAAAVFIAATVIPLGLFGMVDKPSAIGQLPDGELPTESLGILGLDWGVPVKQAVRVPMFWVITAATATASMLVTGLTFHQIDILQTAGLSSTEAAVMFLPQVLGGVGAGLATGVVLDRVGGRYLPAAAMVVLTFTLMLATQLGSNGQIILYAITLGSTGGIVRTSSTTLIPKWFGTKFVGTLNGMIGQVGVAASAAGPLLLTLTQEAFDSYATAVAVLAVIPATVALAATLFKPPVRPTVAA